MYNILFNESSRILIIFQLIRSVWNIKARVHLITAMIQNKLDGANDADKKVDNHVNSRFDALKFECYDMV